MTSFLCHFAPLEVGRHLLPGLQHKGIPRHHCTCISAVKTLFRYDLKETIHIYYLILKQYLKHEKVWRKNKPVKLKVMLISREVIVKRATSDEQTDADSKQSASVIAAALAICGLTDSDVHTIIFIFFCY